MSTATRQMYLEWSIMSSASRRRPTVHTSTRRTIDLLPRMTSQSTVRPSIGYNAAESRTLTPLRSGIYCLQPEIIPASGRGRSHAQTRAHPLRGASRLGSRKSSLICMRLIRMTCAISKWISTNYCLRFGRPCRQNTKGVLFKLSMNMVAMLGVLNAASNYRGSCSFE